MQQMDPNPNRSWTMAATAAAAGMVALAFGLFLAVGRDTLARDESGCDAAAVATDHDDDESFQVVEIPDGAMETRVITVSHSSGDDGQVITIPETRVITVTGDGDGDDDDGSDAESFAYSEAFGDSNGKMAYLGVTLAEDTKSDEGGAVIQHLAQNGPAAKAGMKDGDVIVSVDGTVVRGPARVTEKLRKAKPGDKIMLDARRDGRVQKFTVELGKRPGKVWSYRFGDDNLTPEQKAELEMKLKDLDVKIPEIQNNLGKLKFYAPGRHGLMMWGRRPLLGVEMVETTPELREVLGGRKDAGVLVGKIIAGSAAEKGGLKVGDLIVSIDGTKIDEAGELTEAIQKSEGKTVDIEVIRDKRTTHVKAVLPKIDEPEDVPTGPRASSWPVPAIAPRAPLPPRVPAPPRVRPAPPAPPAPPASTSEFV